MKWYIVRYKEYDFSYPKWVSIHARSSEQAYYDALDLLEYEYDLLPYSAWVEKAILKDGSEHWFNKNIEGKPY